MDILDMTGLIILLALITAMFLVVPVERIRRLALFGVIFGVFFPIGVIGLMQNLLGFWDYRAVDPLNLAGIPVFLSLAWAPALLIFSHLMIQYRSPVLRLLLWLAVAAGVTWLQYLHIINDMLVYRNWTITGTFILTLAIHAGIIVALHLMGHLRLQDLLRVH